MDRSPIDAADNLTFMAASDLPALPLAATLSAALPTHAFVHDVLGVMNPTLALVRMESAEDSERRTPEPRQRTLIKALLSGRDLPEQEVIIRNVSAHGMCIAPQVAMPSAGEEVSLRLPSSLRIRGAVCWSDGKTFGVELERELDIKDLMRADPRARPRIVDAIDMLVDRHFEHREGGDGNGADAR
ncbi:PilZ domain-containing protein [Novosphingobium sp. 9]|uniref:PilZ domain-containing protein n=1 Tax=Novosphingobium sp. 9 TaxID=2025349 RepID=UPI0021B585D3|nr:PilZ domain-containing protein [Novosphingobium sp. 9]